MTDREWRWYVLVSASVLGAVLVSTWIADLIIWWGR